MDTLNALLAVLALATVVVAIFVTRSHRHDLVCLGVPVLGIIFAVIPLFRVMRAANQMPADIESRLSTSEQGWPGEQIPCGSRGTSSDSETRVLIATIVAELGAIRPMDLLFTHLSSFVLGILASVVAAILVDYWTWRRRPSH